MLKFSTQKNIFFVFQNFFVWKESKEIQWNIWEYIICQKMESSKLIN
jgi:hypothetical protein